MGTDPNARTRGPRLRRLRSHPWLTAGALVSTVAAIIFVLVWFQPQALLFDTVVDDEFPTRTEPTETVTAPGPDAPDPTAPDPDESDATDPPNEGEAPTGEPVQPEQLATGNFASRNRYTVTGTASVFALEDGSRTLRLEDFESTNGPDLYVYLTAADHADPDDELDNDVVDLGALRGNVGNQNYEVPPEVDLEHYDTVVIWCLRFTTSFGAADLAPA